MKKRTTIQLEKETMDRLKQYKIYTRETYNEQIQRLLNLIDDMMDNPVNAAELNKQDLRKMKNE